MADYPEHEKLKKISDKSQTVGDFLEWLNSQGIYLMTLEASMHDEWTAPQKSRVTLLAEFFEIDQAKLEEEKRVMFEDARSG
jgi:hypothetical protein